MAKWFSCFKCTATEEDGSERKAEAPSAFEAIPTNLPQTGPINSRYHIQATGVEFKSRRDLDMSYSSSPLAILVLACQHIPPSREVDSTHFSMEPVYCNKSALRAFHPSLTAFSEGSACDGASEVLSAFERLEPALLQDVRGHILRFASGDPAGSLTLHLAARKYPPAPSSSTGFSSSLRHQHHHQHRIMDSAQTISGNKQSASTFSSAVVTSSDASHPIPNRQRLWHYVVLEPCLYITGGAVMAKDGGAAPGIVTTRHICGSGSGLLRRSKLYRVSYVNHKQRQQTPKINGTAAVDYNGDDCMNSLQDIPTSLSSHGSGGSNKDSVLLPAIILKFQLLSQYTQQPRTASQGAATAAVVNAIPYRDSWPKTSPLVVAPRVVLSSSACSSQEHPALLAQSSTEVPAKSSKCHPYGNPRCVVDSVDVMPIATVEAAECYSINNSSRWQQQQDNVRQSVPALHQLLRLGWPAVRQGFGGRQHRNQQDSGPGASGTPSGTVMGTTTFGCGFTSGPLTEGVAEAFRAREGMVLAGLAPIVTAFTLSGKAVLYQNVTSLLYLGLRARAPAMGYNMDRIISAAAAAAGGEDAAAVSDGENILAEIFCFEPAKLERMLNEVCIDGRVWKGIVEVPLSCHPALSPLAEAAAAAACDFGCGSVANSGVNRVGLAGHAGALTKAASGQEQRRHGPPLMTASPGAGPVSREAQLQQTPPSHLQQGQSPVTPGSPLGVHVLPRVSGLDFINCSLVMAAVPTAAAAAAATAVPATAADRALSDGFCSSLLNVGLSTLDVSMPKQVEALAKMKSIVDSEPMATSTWGLLIDTPEQGPHQHDLAVMAEAPDGGDRGVATAADAFTQVLTSSNNAQMLRGVAAGGELTMSAALQSAATSRTLRSGTRLPSFCNDTLNSAKDLVNDTDSAATIAMHRSPCVSPGGRGRSGGRGGGGGQGEQHELVAPVQTPTPMPTPFAMRGMPSRQTFDALVISATNFNAVRPADTSSNCTGGDGDGGGGSGGGGGSALAGLVGRTTSAIIPNSCQQQMLSARATGLPRRAATRADLNAASSTRSFSRLVTFASTLRNTPSSVQMALQAAVAGSSVSSAARTMSQSSIVADLPSFASMRGHVISSLAPGEGTWEAKGNEAGVGKHHLKQMICVASAMGSNIRSGGQAQLEHTSAASPLAAPLAPASMLATAATTDKLYSCGGGWDGGDGGGDGGGGGRGGGGGGGGRRLIETADSWCGSRMEREDLLIPLQRKTTTRARPRTTPFEMHISDGLYCSEAVAPPASMTSRPPVALLQPQIVETGAEVIEDATEAYPCYTDSTRRSQSFVNAATTMIAVTARCRADGNTPDADADVSSIQQGKEDRNAHKTAEHILGAKDTRKLGRMDLFVGSASGGGVRAGAGGADARQGAKNVHDGDDRSNCDSGAGGSRHDNEVEGDAEHLFMYEENAVNDSGRKETMAQLLSAAAMTTAMTAARSGGTCWHEICASRTTDPLTGQYAIILTQTDVTTKVEAERHIALVTETQHRLLEQIFPRHVLAYMTEEGGPWAAPAKPDLARCWRPVVRDINKLATSHDEVTLLFADIQGFTPMCRVLEPRVVMAFLNDLFTRFDRRLDEFGVYKVETIGDCYFVAGGLIHEDEDGMAAVRGRDSHADPHHAERVMKFAEAMLSAAAEVSLPTTGGPVKMRIGIHSGPVVSGVVGQRMPRFCLFGDTVNTASRMESTGVPGCIHASEAARSLLRGEAWVPTGGIEVKGKGLMSTYLWAPPGPESGRGAVATVAAVDNFQQLPKQQQHGQNTSFPPLVTDRKALPLFASVCNAGGGSVLPTIIGSSDISGGCDTVATAGTTTTHRTATVMAAATTVASLTLNSAGGFAHVWPSAPSSAGGAANENIGELARMLLSPSAQ